MQASLRLMSGVKSLNAGAQLVLFWQFMAINKIIKTVKKFVNKS